MLVHITDEKTAAAIWRGGIRVPKQGGVYFMPVLQSHFISHQWIRELRRRGSRVQVGVYFRLPSADPVWAGRYNDPHRQMMLGHAIKELLSLDDPLGFEIFIDRPVLASQVKQIRGVPSTVGWRYMPHAHGRPLCGCPTCLPRGAIKSHRLRERLEPSAVLPTLDDVKARLLAGATDDEISDLLWALRRKRRRTDPEFLSSLISSESTSVREDVALTLPYFRHADSMNLLEMLALDLDDNVARAAAEGLAEIASRRSRSSSDEN
jgi:hypothetical protein